MQHTSYIDPTDPRYVIINGNRLLRVMGGSPDDDDVDGDDADDENDDDEGGKPEGSEEQKPKQQKSKKPNRRQRKARQATRPSGSEDDDGASDEDDSDEEGSGEPQTRQGQFPWDEYNRLKRKVAEEEKARKKTEKRKALEEGRLQDIISESERERDEALAHAEEAKYELDTYRRRSTVSKVANRLNFHDPEMVFDLIDEEDADSEQTVEHALRKLAKDKPFLVDRKRRSGAPVNGQQGKQPTPEEGLSGAIRQVLTGGQTEDED